MTASLISRRTWLQRAGISTLALTTGVGELQANTLPVVDHQIGLTHAKYGEVKELIHNFMVQHMVPGLSLAMSFKGELKFAMGMGYADKEQKQHVFPNSIFRLASVSKPFTSVLIMKLIEEEQLKLDDKVFGEQGHLHSIFDISTLEDETQREYASKITVQNLLEHTCGGWGNKQKDPMFNSKSLKLNQHELIAWTLQNVKLEHEPGKDYSYSNFGYCLLGRVIEKITSKTYFEALKEKILKPADIKTIRVGGSTLEERLPNEVKYYGWLEPAYSPIINYPRMDSHGGLISSAPDLLKFTRLVDGHEKFPDIISKETLEIMKTPSSVNPNYAKGWSFNKAGNYWHNGSLNGVSSFMVITHDHYSWAVMVNTRSSNKEYFKDLDQLPWNIRKTLGELPDHDLFSSGLF